MTRGSFIYVLMLVVSSYFVIAVPVAWIESPLVHRSEATLPYSAEGNEAPWFCHNLDCPGFKTVKKYGKFDLRCYNGYQWVTTNTSDLDYDKAKKTNFLRLYDYISGANVGKQKIPMTAPVAVHFIPGQGPFCATTYVMSFFVPFKWQNKAPAPSNSNVYFSNVSKFCAYVRSFGGYPEERNVVQNAVQLNEDLQKSKIKDYNSQTYFYAGYDSPFRPVNRHNEIWFMQRK